jgi:hypothetical protein
VIDAPAKKVASLLSKLRAVTNGRSLSLKLCQRRAMRRGRRNSIARRSRALYQQEPTQEVGSYFKDDWLIPILDLPSRSLLNVYGASDYAVTSDGGDYTVHVVIGIDQRRRMFLLDLWRQQTSSNVWIEAWCDLVTKWKPTFWAEEKTQITFDDVQDCQSSPGTDRTDRPPNGIRS